MSKVELLGYFILVVFIVAFMCGVYLAMSQIH
jgi:hypothetical protein